MLWMLWYQLYNRFKSLTKRNTASARLKNNGSFWRTLCYHLITTLLLSLHYMNNKKVFTTTLSSRYKSEPRSILLWLGIVWTLKYNGVSRSNRSPHPSFVPTHYASPLLLSKTLNSLWQCALIIPPSFISLVKLGCKKPGI